MIVWSSAGRSNVEAITSPSTLRCMSVTSSGRSSTNTTIRWQSGSFVVIALAIACNTMVFPAFGGDTISPRWPLPIGATMSITRVVRFELVVSNLSRSCGYSGVNFEKSGRFLAVSMSSPFMDSTLTKGLNFSRRSPSRACRTEPITASPLRSPYLRTNERETYTSFGPGR